MIKGEFVKFFKIFLKELDGLFSFCYSQSTYLGFLSVFSKDYSVVQSHLFWQEKFEV